jgi:hypothetical protein
MTAALEDGEIESTSEAFAAAVPAPLYVRSLENIDVSRKAALRPNDMTAALAMYCVLRIAYCVSIFACCARRR